MFVKQYLGCIGINDYKFMCYRKSHSNAVKIIDGLSVLDLKHMIEFMIKKYGYDFETYKYDCYAFIESEKVIITYALNPYSGEKYNKGYEVILKGIYEEAETIEEVKKRGEYLTIGEVEEGITESNEQLSLF